MQGGQDTIDTQIWTHWTIAFESRKIITNGKTVLWKGFAIIFQPFIVDIKELLRTKYSSQFLKVSNISFVITLERNNIISTNFHQKKAKNKQFFEDVGRFPVLSMFFRIAVKSENKTRQEQWLQKCTGGNGQTSLLFTIWFIVDSVFFEQKYWVFPRHKYCIRNNNQICYNIKYHAITDVQRCKHTENEMSQNSKPFLIFFRANIQDRIWKATGIWCFLYICCEHHWRIRWDTLKWDLHIYTFTFTHIIHQNLHLIISWVRHNTGQNLNFVTCKNKVLKLDCMVNFQLLCGNGIRLPVESR